MSDDVNSSECIGGQHPARIARTSDPSQHPLVFAAAFNSGDPAAVEQLYEDLGILVPEPGQPVSGRDRAAANTALLELGLPIEVRPRHIYTVDDIALLIVDWSVTGTGRDGTPVHISGTATDVARLGLDGTWRYIIDNPFGTA
jgi:ketosteroid isomerase-like protein